MAEIIEMPLMSDTMTEGVIVSWQKKVGDKVKAGEPIAEIETDKATMDLESYFDGVLLYVAADAGGAIKVGDLLAILGKEGEDAAALVTQYRTQKGGGGSPTAKTSESTSTTQPNVPANSPAPVVSSSTNESTDGRIKASPLAKSIAEQKGISLANLTGTGEGGRIIKRDVEALPSQPASGSVVSPAVPSSSSFSFANGSESYEDVPLSQMRKTIARRLGESKFSAPHYYLTMEIEMSKVMKMRAKLNEESSHKISINDFIVKACALALKKHPKVNASWLGDSVRYYHHVHVGVAVAIEDGLVVPVIRFADGKGLSDIAGEIKILATRAKNKELQPDEFKGNTFTVSNLGMYGIDQFTAIINPPDACILAVGGIKEVLKIKDKDKDKKKSIGFKYAQIMKVTLSCDHRVVDGSVGSEFLQTVKNLLENPLKMML